MAKAKKFYPTVEELTKVEFIMTCPEPECDKKFTSSSHLTLHLVKTHKRTSLMPSKEPREFYCPEEKCIYNAKKFFKSLKDIKQHYRKVHVIREFVCESCQKTFISEQQKKSHISYCGVLFSCTECEMKYSTYEVLITHTRRKSHRLLPKSAYRIKQTVSDSRNAKKPNEKKITPAQYRTLLPKPGLNQKPVYHVIVLPTQKPNVENQTDETNNNSTQTDIGSQKKNINSPKEKAKKQNASTKRSTQQTQTAYKKKPKLNVQMTKTLRDLFGNDSCSSETINNFLAKKSTNTQTKHSELLSFNNLFPFNSGDFSIDAEKTNSSTQTNKNWLSNLEAPDDSISLLDFSHSFDSNFFNCNTETQTDFFFDEELLDCNYYADTHTQTCEHMLLGDISFTDIETQTVMQESCSVESQTSASVLRKVSNVYRDMSHIETQTDIQTDIEFKKKTLEEINS